MKLVAFLVLLLLAWRVVAGRWPWQPKGESTASRRVAAARARNLLGVTANSNRQDILDAHRRMVAAVHPDKGGSNEQVHEANAARDLLLGELSNPS
ncbi:MAG TPA: molecular chaperone DnaJ [Novosphingobium sp.]|nr:molecular chaperone DnaJ [Novosphingobium sp.]